MNDKKKGKNIYVISSAIKPTNYKLKRKNVMRKK